MKERTSNDLVKDLEAWKASQDVRIKEEDQIDVCNLSRCCDTIIGLWATYLCWAHWGASREGVMLLTLI
jgi:hypothetical protein